MAVLWIIMVPVLLMGQSTNPFEIHSRLDSGQVHVEISEQQVAQQETALPQPANPFERTASKGATTEKNNLSKQTFSNNDRRKGPGNTFFLLYALISGSLLAFGIALNRDQFSGIVASISNSNYLKSLIRNGRIWSDVQSYLLYGLFFLNVSMFIYISILEGMIHTAVQSQWLLVLILASLILIYLGRHFFLWLLSAVYPLGQGIKYYNHSVGMHNMVVGFIILPVVLGLQYGPPSGDYFFFVAGIVVIVGIYFLRQAKGLMLAFSTTSFNPMYFFIYLCAVEMAPIFIGLRLLKQVT